MTDFKCTKCTVLKDTSLFPKECRSKRGHTTICKDCTNSYLRIYKKTYRKTAKHIEAHRAYQKSDHYKKWQREHKRKPEQREKENQYRKTHKMSEESRVKMNNYRMRRYSASPKVRVDHSMAVSIGYALRGNKGGCKWESLVNYTVNQLMRHLEPMFDESMSWSNYGSHWHIDHIVPKSHFKYDNADSKEFNKCWGLDNLQPMEAIENLRKGNRLIYNIRKELAT